MQGLVVPILGALLLLLAIAGFARLHAASPRQRSALSIALVVLGLLAAFFLFFAAGSWVRSHRAQPRPHASAHSMNADSPAPALRLAWQSSALAGPNPSLHRKTHSRLQRPRFSGELKR